MYAGIEKLDEGTVATFRGVVTSKEIRDANFDCYARRETEKVRFEIFVFEEIEDFVISTSELRMIALDDATAHKKNPIDKLAIVTESKLVFGVARMYEVFKGEDMFETEIFKNMKEAHIWLESS